jgi:hypothetical protein
MVTEDYLSDIIDDIDHGKCVLIIGPDLCDFGSKSFFEVMCDEFSGNPSHSEALENFKTDNSNASQYIFLNEELIQPKQGGSYEMKVKNMVKRFYQKQDVFNEPFKKIALIPFNLILSLMPDDRLAHIFEEQNLPYSFGYYPVEEIKQEITEFPSKEKPLIYNILGSFDKNDAVISFDSMFKFLSNILKNDLPSAVNRKLSESSTFLFLGVHFERWHAQLLLKIISPKGISYNISKKHNNHDVSVFVSHRLRLDLLDNSPEVFLNRLFSECEAKHEELLKKGKTFLKIPPKPAALAKAFISYSHDDMEIAKELTAMLKQNQVEAIIDENDMNGGQQIDDFIDKIKAIAFVIPIISKNSLYKPFVFKELRIAIAQQKKLIPCCLDQQLFDNSIQEEHIRIIDNQLEVLNNQIATSKDNKVDHLITERGRWIDYKADFPIVIDHLRNLKCRAVTQDNIAELVGLVLKDIHAHSQL